MTFFCFKKTIGALITLFITSALLLAPFLSFAATYSVKPLLINHELEKRDIIQEVITLTNHESRTIRIFPTVNEVAVTEGGAIQNFVEPSMADRTTSITSWLEISRARLELAPGETKELTLTIRVNPDVAAGEYHAFVGFPEGPNRDEAQRRVYEGIAPGTVVRVGVDKVQNQFLRLEKFVVERFVKNSTEGEISYTLRNPGTDPVVPKGEIIFYDNNGSEVSAIDVNTEGVVIAGGKEAVFLQEIPNEMKMGKYKAFLSVEYGEHQSASVHDTAFFYVLPLTTILIIFAVVLVIAILFALYIHRKYDGEIDSGDGAEEVSLFIRQGVSESKEHDIDLSKKNTN